MTQEYIVYARKETEPDYMEEVVMTTHDKNNVIACMEYAKENGYIIRVVEFKLELPDFLKAIAI